MSTGMPTLEDINSLINQIDMELGSITSFIRYVNYEAYCSKLAINNMRSHKISVGLFFELKLSIEKFVSSINSVPSADTSLLMGAVQELESIFAFDVKVYALEQTIYNLMKTKDEIEKMKSLVDGHIDSCKAFRANHNFEISSIQHVFVDKVGSGYTIQHELNELNECVDSTIESITLVVG